VSKATEALARLRGVDPRDADAVFNAVMLANGAGLEAEALPLARAGAEASPDAARMWLLLGALLRRLDRLAEAVPALIKATELVPDDALLAHTHARTTMEAGLPAIALFERAHLLAPDDGGVLLGRAAAYVAEGRLDEAIAGLEDQLRLFPNWLEGHGVAARLRWIRGEQDSFAHSLEEALRAAPANIALWHGLLDILTHGNLYERVHEVVARARAAAGQSPVFDGLEAAATAEQGRAAEADRLFAALGPFEHVAMAVRYVRHLLRAGRPAEAAVAADQWADRDPDGVMVPYQSLAWRLTGDPRWQWLEGDDRLVGVYDLADRLPMDALAARLRGLHMHLHQPMDQSLRGGTQTHGGLFSRIEPEIQALRAAVVDAVESYVAQLPSPAHRHPTLVEQRDEPIRFAGSWSVRLTGEGFHVNHVHPAGWISSAFYVALPEAAMGGADQTGWLSLGEATELGLDLPPIRRIEPKPGRLVLFPSSMWHGTRPFAKGERLTVAFDVARPGQQQNP
jgi:tetratricopeptide (TPR) repeat protein